MSKMKESLQCSLSINQLELPVLLGWPDQERQQSQIVSVDIHMSFASLPKACYSDHLDDTFCYDWLTQQIKAKTADKQFHLLEHLTQTILSIIKELIKNTIMISVNVTKKPPIKGLTGGVTFSCVEFTEMPT